eukprot:TRINITY_DN32350_c0_g1_i1.p1 TRINITY_DN32350_c0_g1~~TRINITY_DN32350_c0_g1_i1.p1  ORF type:complete len:1062 (+),score=197.31 TRINITY_DN32350_c0_g1_i1:128-3313(+)
METSATLPPASWNTTSHLLPAASLPHLEGSILPASRVANYNSGLEHIFCRVPEEPRVSGVSNASAADIEREMDKRESQYKTTRAESVLVSLQLNSVLCFVQLFVFSCLLCCNRPRRILAPRLKGDAPCFFLGWAFHAWNRSHTYVDSRKKHQDAMEEKPSERSIWKAQRHWHQPRLRSLDGAVMVRFCVLGFKFSLAGSLAAAGLVPLYMGGPGRASDESFNRFNLSNLQDPSGAKSSKFWVVVVVAYMLSFIFGHLMLEEWTHFITMRKRHFFWRAGVRDSKVVSDVGGEEDESTEVDPSAAQALRSVLVELIPPDKNQLNGFKVRAFFEQLFPGEVHSVVVQAETGLFYYRPEAVLAIRGQRDLQKFRRALKTQLNNSEQAIVQAEHLVRRVETGAAARSSSMLAAESPSMQQSGRVAPRSATHVHLGEPEDASERSPAPIHRGVSEPAFVQWLLDRSASRLPLSVRESRNSAEYAVESLTYSAPSPVHAQDLQADERPQLFWDGLQYLGDRAINMGWGIIARARDSADLVQRAAIGSMQGADAVTGSSTAFVTFRSVSSRVAAEQLVLEHSDGRLEERWHVRAAPEQNEIVWANAAVPLAQVRFRGWLARLILTIGVLFWSTPCLMLQTYTYNVVPQVFNGLLDVNGKWSSSAVQLYFLLMDYLPVLVMMGLLYLLPYLFEAMSQFFEGEKLKSDIQRRTLGRFFLFQVATLYFTVMSGSFSANLCEILKRPENVFSLLQTQVPQVACYFITYVATRAGLSMPMLLLFPLLNPLFDCGSCCSCCCSGTSAAAKPASRDSAGERCSSSPRLAAVIDDTGSEDRNSERSAEETEPEAKDGSETFEVPCVQPNYAMEASSLGMVLVLGLTYACIAPAILPVCMVFFAFGSVVYRWLFLFVYEPEFDCSGAIWYELSDGCMIGMIFGTLSLAGFAAAYVSATSVEFYALLLLAVLNGGLYQIMTVHYARPSMHMSYRDAREIDRLSARNLTSCLADDYYIDPIIKEGPLDDQEHGDDDSDMERGCSCWCSRTSKSNQSQASEEEESSGDEISELRSHTEGNP